MNRRRPSIAIDGPVAAGKSTIARLVAQALGCAYIDSGAMYRALAWAARQQRITADQLPRLHCLLEHINIRLLPGPEGRNLVWVGDRDVTQDIRSPEIGQLASQLSELPEVRRFMVALQQEMARAGGVVMEGRDIQTVVLPDAEVKIFLTASPETRAERRWRELQKRGLKADLHQVLAEIQARDRRDSTRADSPLRAALDAVHLDTDGLSIEQVVERVLAIARARGAGAIT